VRDELKVREIKPVKPICIHLFTTTYPGWLQQGAFSNYLGSDWVQVRICVAPRILRWNKIMIS
jgi:hypothetical protein